MEFICQTDEICLKDELLNHISKKLYRKLKFLNSDILVNGVSFKTFQRINKGDKITIEYEKEDNIKWPIYESNLDIYYEDKDYLIVNKKSGVLTIPTKSEPYSLYQEVLFYLKNTNQDLAVSILNRLDKDTKGLVVVAKNRLAAYYLQPTHEKMIRKYKCLCYGNIKEDEGIIKNYINKEPDSHRRFNSSTQGKQAISHYKVLKRNKNTTLLEFQLETGRTHQIRLHCLCLGTSIVGDTMYGKDESNDLHLCSYYIEFIHPFTKKRIKCQMESGWE